MSTRNIFVPWWSGNTSEAQLDAALSIAREVEAHLDVFFIKADQMTMSAALVSSSVVPTEVLEEIEHGNKRAAAEARNAFASWRVRNATPCDLIDGQTHSVFARWNERSGLPEQVIVRRGRLSDLIVLGFPDASGRMDRALDAALFESGRPVLVVPKRPCDSLLSNVFIAWNGSLEATRAVVGAMSLLHKADKVTVLTASGAVEPIFNPASEEDLDLQAALSWHGITAYHRIVDAAGHSTGEALIKTAISQNASLFVMGAYTHSRVTAAFLGGMTGYVLANPPPMPLLMAH